ncbi:MAG: hypothetical protein ACK2T2_07930 [Anaerolineales bacterium]|jgi:hypothetical protein
MRKLPVLILSVILLSSCQAGTPPAASESELATAVSATLSSIDTTATQGEKSAPPASSTPEAQPPQPGPLFSNWILAYSDGMTISVRIDGQPAVTVSNRGVILSLVLSEDGRTIVYGRSDERGENYELRAVDSNGANDRLLLDESTLDALHPLGMALHIRPSQMGFIPGTHRLLVNTRGIFEGPGLAKYDDLLALDVDSGTLTELLPAGQGGDFYLAPNAQRMVLSQSDNLSLANVDGGSRQADVIQFDPVITYSEYAYYPVPRWAPDSSRFGVIIPSPDPLASDPGGTVWIAEADGGPAESMAVLDGDTFFPQSFGSPLISPELLDLAFLRTMGNSNERELYLARVDGSSEQLYVTGNLAWVSWNPDSIRFVYRIQPDQYFLGSKGANPQLLGQGRRLEWIDENTFLLLAGQVGSWQLSLKDVGGGSTMLVDIASDSLIYDFVH